MAYLIETAGKRWLFPGDTRIYDARLLPDMGSVDSLFAHLWLGRGEALQTPPPLLKPFCQFCLDLQPDQIILTHLEELGRDADDFWDASHVKLVQQQFEKQRASIPILPVYMGDRVCL